MCPRPCLILVILITVFLVPSQTQKIYEFCDNLSSNVVNINATSPPVLIHSPQYGRGSHKHFQKCSLVIISGKEPLILYLHFIHFDLEYHDLCRYDSLCVHGIIFCGNWTTGQKYTYILPEISYFTLQFKTDVSVINSGFQIKVTAEPAISQTIWQVTSGVGSSQSNIQRAAFTYQPGFPYTDTCEQHIATSNVTLSGCTMHTFSPLSSQRGWVDSFCISFCGTSRAPFQLSQTRVASQIVYYFCDPKASNIVNINTISRVIIVRSPNYGAGNYNGGQSCPLVIRSDREPLILSLHHTSFDIEPHSACGYDSLCVHGVKFCGNWSAGLTYKYILPINSSFTLEFRTDGSVNKSGFEIRVTAHPATMQTIEEVTGGVGSSQNSISTTVITYQSGLSYTDRCANNPRSTALSRTSKMLGVFYMCDSSPDDIVLINATSSVPIPIPRDSAEICWLVITEPQTVFLHNNFLDLVYEDSCGKDFLCTHGVKLCGLQETTQTYVIEIEGHSFYSLKITTDTLVTRSDSQIHVSQELSNNGSTEIGTDIFGAQYDYTLHTNVTYYSTSPFMDRCTSEIDSIDYPPESETTAIGQFVREQISALIEMALMQPQYKPLKV